MKKIWIPIMVVALLLLTASLAFAATPDSKNFVSPLSGAEEFPARDTLARGNAIFHSNSDDSALSYKLIVANINNVVAAHIHCGAPGVNGPVGVTLYSGGVPGGGRTDGVLSQGTATAPDAGNGCGWMSMGDVLEAMRSGNAYVNVHTSDGVPPADTGPGDFPGGEIRGQVRVAGPSN